MQIWRSQPLTLALLVTYCCQPTWRHSCSLLLESDVGGKLQQQAAVVGPVEHLPQTNRAEDEPLHDEVSKRMIDVFNELDDHVLRTVKLIEEGASKVHVMHEVPTCSLAKNHSAPL